MDSEYFIYLLESEKSGVWYVGLSADPESRLLQHNQGKSKFTSGHIPWRLLYKERAENLAQARKLQKATTRTHVKWQRTGFTKNCCCYFGKQPNSGRNKNS